VLWEHIRRTECGFRNGGQAAGPSYRVNNGFRLGLPLAFKKEEQPERPAERIRDSPAVDAERLIMEHVAPL